jgi:hypothetical protein
VTHAVTDTPLPRYELVRGGTPTPEQLAALVVALTPVPVVEEGVDGQDTPATTPAWLRAALLEGVGDRRYASPGDLAHATEPR